MANGLQPSYVVINYHTAYGVHKMTIPTRQWSPSPAPTGQFLTWNDGAVDADTMITDLVTELADFWPETTTFDDYVIYNFPDPDGDSNPVASGTLAIDGTNVVAGWSKAVQQTISLRTTAFGLAKLVLLDVSTGNQFDLVTAGAFTAAYDDVLDQLSDEDHAWAGRDNKRVVQMVQAATTLNERLRREYRMN